MARPNGTKRTTIQDIADHANVSISTVSRVLNGNVSVAKAKQDAVLHAVDELGYKPNAFAKGLASGQSMAIGILTQNISSPFYDAILRGLLDGLRGTSYSPMIVDGHWQPRKEQKVIESLMARRVDGMVVLGGISPSPYFERLSTQTPLVVVARQLEALEKQCIVMANEQGGYEATKHLIELGHHQVAHIAGIASHQDSVDRENGYRRALEEAGIRYDRDLIVEGRFTEQSGLLALEMLLMRGRSFSAIFCANDQMAYGARLGLFRHGIRVPADVSIVGYDDQPASAYVIPPLTTVRHPANEIGRKAAQSILQLIKGEHQPVAPYPAELVVRESTAMLR